MTYFHPAHLIMLALTCGPAGAQTPAPDLPANYSHAIALTVSGKNAMVQLRLPPAAYLNAHSASLDDLRVFDARGAALPFALLHPATEAKDSRRQFAVKLFPVGVAEGDTRDVRNDVDIKLAPDGSVTSISSRHAAASAPAADGHAGLILDFGSERTPVDALVFTLPDGVTNYQAQVALEVSDDLQRWETVGYANLAWLANRERDTLTSNRMEFGARTMRYGRLYWPQGNARPFAAIMAESRASADVAPAQDSIVLPPHAGRFPNDLAYDAPIGLPVSRLGLNFSATNVVMPALVGHYIELPTTKGSSATRWEFSPRLQTTVFQITQDGKQRGSRDIELDEVHATSWVIRAPDARARQPALRLAWTPQTLVFLGSGAPPYTLHVGRDKARSMQRAIDLVAPGFSGAELQGLEQAVAGPVKASGPDGREASAALEAGRAAHQRVLILWAMLLLGVGVLGFMAWKLVAQMKKAD
ncbi:MAG: DUF3999 family protein [Pseudomonadota bacterium]